jgi:hypothetical protein
MGFFVLALCVPAAAQQKTLWQGTVKPDAINVYANTSTGERVSATLKQGDAVDVVLQISTSGDAWCRVSLAGTSEPLGYVLCFNLERGSSAANQIAHTQQVAAQSHLPATVAAPSSTSVTAPAPSAAALGSVALTNNDILDMNKAGLPQGVLVAKIKSSQCNFDTSPSQLKKLKAAGLADPVILAMVEVPTGHVPPSDPSPVSSAGTEANAEHSQPGEPAVHHKMVLEDNTPVHLVLSENLSSASATTGQTISFEVSEDVLVSGFLVIPRGSLAWGTVTDAQAKRRLGRAGHLDVNIDKVRLADGEKVLLSATSHVKGGSHTAAMTAGIVATSLVLWPAAPFFLFMHGHDITIPKGTKIEAFTNGDATLDAAKFAPAPK